MSNVVYVRDALEHWAGELDAGREPGITPAFLRQLASMLRRNNLRPRAARQSAAPLDAGLMAAMDAMLRDVPPYSHREIAQALGVHEGRVAERWHARFSNQGTPRIQEKFKP